MYNARSNRCHDPTSPNIAPATKYDAAKFQRKCSKTGETSFTMRGRSENAPTMTREWSENETVSPQTRLATKLTFPGHHEHFVMEITTFCAPAIIQKVTKCCACGETSPNTAPATKCDAWTSPSAAPARKSDDWTLHLPRKVTLEFTKNCACHEKVEPHQVLHLPRKVTLELHQKLPLPRNVTLELHQVLHLPGKVTIELYQVLHLPRKVTLEPHQVLRLPRHMKVQPYQILRLPRKMTRTLDSRYIWYVIYNAWSNRCHDPTSPHTAVPATKNDAAKFQRKCSKTGETSFTMRGQSENAPTMTREWSNHDPRMKPSVRNPPRNQAYFSRSPRAFCNENYNISKSHQVLRLPREVTLQPHQILPLSRKVTLELHLTLLYSTLPYSTLLYFTRLYFILLCCTPLYFSLLYSTLLYPTLLYSTLLYSTLRYATLLYSALPYSTLFDSTPRSCSYIGNFSAKLPLIILMWDVNICWILNEESQLNWRMFFAAFFCIFYISPTFAEVHPPNARKLSSEDFEDILGQHVLFMEFSTVSRAVVFLDFHEIATNSAICGTKQIQIQKRHSYVLIPPPPRRCVVALAFHELRSPGCDLLRKAILIAVAIPRLLRTRCYIHTSSKQDASNQWLVRIPSLGTWVSWRLLMATQVKQQWNS